MFTWLICYFSLHPIDLERGRRCGKEQQSTLGGRERAFMQGCQAFCSQQCLFDSKVDSKETEKIIFWTQWMGKLSFLVKWWRLMAFVMGLTFISPDCVHLKRAEFLLAGFFSFVSATKPTRASRAVVIFHRGSCGRLPQCQDCIARQRAGHKLCLRTKVLSESVALRVLFRGLFRYAQWETSV